MPAVGYALTPMLYTTTAGGHDPETLFLEAGETVETTLASSGTVRMNVMSTSTYEAWAAGYGVDPGGWESGDGDLAHTFTAPSTGDYHFIVSNPTAETITVGHIRTWTRLENAKDVLGMVYDYFQDMDFVYSSLIGSYYDTAQYVRLPSEVLDDGAGNCVDASVVFASILEAIGMEPIIDIIPGHAMVSVKVSPESSRVLSVETTLIGSGTSFDDAVSAGTSSLIDAEYHHAVNVLDLRESGITPMP
jgi:hypothetical protein